jgi:putative transposase
MEEANYTYFLVLYGKYIQPIADTFAYCLMRNHFHILVRSKTLEEQDQHGEGIVSKHVQPSQQFSNLLIAYAKAINQRYQRGGSLFQSRFGRKLILTDKYLYAAINYIHRNPQHHHFVDDFRDWHYSSYHALVSDKPTRLNRGQVLEWFGGNEQLRTASLVFTDQEAIQPLFIDD